MNNSNFSFINNLSQSEKNYNLLILPQYLLYVTTHLRFSSAFPSTQLVDIMSYEVPSNHPTMSNLDIYHPESSSVIIYNFHSLYSQDRFFLFTQPSYAKLSEGSLRNQSVASVSEVFPAAN